MNKMENCILKKLTRRSSTDHSGESKVKFIKVHQNTGYLVDVQEGYNQKPSRQHESASQEIKTRELGAPHLLLSREELHLVGKNEEYNNSADLIDFNVFTNKPGFKTPTGSYPRKYSQMSNRNFYPTTDTQNSSSDKGATHGPSAKYNLNSF